MDVKERWGEFRREIPGTKVILESSIANLQLAQLSAGKARSRFGDLLQELMLEGLRLLRAHQNQQRERFLKSVLETELPTLPDAIEREVISGGSPREIAQRIVTVVGAEVSGLPGTFFSLPQQSLDQQTKKRAGVHMERAMAFLFGKAGLTFEQQKPKRSDFVFPDLKTWENTPELAVLVSAKHTLAERWKQLMAERHETGRNAYLVTLDALPQDKATNLIGHGFTLYLLPTAMAKLKSSPRIRDLNELPNMIARVVNSS